MAEDALDILDEDVPRTEHGLDGAAVADKRLRFEGRKWLIAKLKPKKYGEKLDLTSGDKPLQIPPNEIVFRVATSRDVENASG
jgi:hypothetical protein